MNARAVVTVDLGFGDAGKGTIVDYLVRADETVGTVVRYNGGPQAAHRVVEASSGREHVFSQFGAGTLVPGVRTFLARGALVNPINLFYENEGLRRVGVKDALSRLAVDSDCVLVTPFHATTNRIREILRGDGRHGSCGQGVGEARADELDGVAIRAGDTTSPPRVRRLLGEIRDRKLFQVWALVNDGYAGLDEAGRSRLRDEFAALERPDLAEVTADAFTDPRFVCRIVWGASLLRGALESGSVVFEGAQGVLLDETHGFHPHTTWTDTTVAPALALLEEVGAEDDVETLGIVRAYATRHGAGPFPTEDADLTAALPDAQNGTGSWQGGFRVGWLDVPLLRYALAVSPTDSLAVTCLDRVAAFQDWKACAFYSGVPQPAPARASCDPVEHSRKLGESLAAAEPVYLPLPPTADAYAEMLEAMTGVPVSLTSHGPTADEKKPVVAAGLLRS